MRRNSIAAEKIEDVKAEEAVSNFLFIDACDSLFLNVKSCSEEFAANSKDSGVSCKSLYFKLGVSGFENIRQLSRIIPNVDAVQLFYDGSVSILRDILPIAILARFFGREARLFYFPGESFFKIKKFHYKLFSLFSGMIVGSRFMQREFEKQKIKTTVQIPFVDQSLVSTRAVSEVQPHILFVHDSPDDSGAVCAMRAFKFVKEKYPRTEMTIVTKEMIPWQVTAEFWLQNYSGVYYIEENNIDGIKKAFSKADIFINCDLSETMPLPLVTAMSSGIPSVSYETYGPREIIEDGVNGFLVRHNDSHQLSDRIFELIEHPDLVEKISQESQKLGERILIK